MPPVISSDKFTIATTQYPSEERPVIPELQLKLKLQILTLSELIQFRGDRLPTDLNGLRELASLYTNHLGTLCTRYRHGFLKYQNVDDEPIQECLEYALSRLTGIPIDSPPNEDDILNVLTDEELAHLQLSLESLNDHQLQEQVVERGMTKPTSEQSKWSLDNISRLAQRGKKSLKQRLIELLMSDATNISSPDTCYDESHHDQQYDFIFAVDTDLVRTGIIPCRKYQDIESSSTRHIQNMYQDYFVYSQGPQSINRIHGFLAMRDGGCNTYHLPDTPNILQLSILCTSPFTDCTIKGFCSVGTYLMGAFLLLGHAMEYQTAVLEVANECVGDEDTTTEDVASSSEDDEGSEGKDDEGVDGSEEEEEDEGIELDEEVSVLSSYGSYEYQKGKDSQKALYCYYERFGFREEPHYNTELGCFSDTPYPSMALDLPSLDLTELSKALVDPTYVVGDYSKYCQEFGNSSVCSS